MRRRCSASPPRAAAIKQNGHATYYTGEWRKYIEGPGMQSWLNDPA
jgi:hypothetical protein